MGSCSQFCLILHPHHVAVGPIFSSNFHVAMAEQLYSNPWQNTFDEGKFGPPLKNDPKTTKIWG